MNKELFIVGYLKAISCSKSAYGHGKHRNDNHLSVWSYEYDNDSKNNVYIPEFGFYLRQTVLYGGLVKKNAQISYKGHHVDITNKEFDELYNIAKVRYDYLSSVDYLDLGKTIELEIQKFIES